MASTKQPSQQKPQAMNQTGKSRLEEKWEGVVIHVLQEKRSRWVKMNDAMLLCSVNRHFSEDKSFECHVVICVVKAQISPRRLKQSSHLSLLCSWDHRCDLPMLPRLVSNSCAQTIRLLQPPKPGMTNAPVVPATREAEPGGFLESRSLRLQ
ncbi:hypothetical protein AAY473_000792 [Plecturocebus cupreus]